jgi:hypothetical protein
MRTDANSRPRHIIATVIAAGLALAAVGCSSSHG